MHVNAGFARLCTPREPSPEPLWATRIEPAPPPAYMTCHTATPRGFAQELMETVMLKHLAAATLGLAVLFGAIGPAAADKARHNWNHNGVFVYPYGVGAYSYGPGSPNYVTRSRSEEH